MVKRLTYIYLALLAALTVNLPSRADTPEVGALEVYPDGMPYGPDVITLGEGGGQIIVSFDLLEPERRFLRYRLTHCDAQWRPDALTPIEYTRGFNEGRVDDYAQSMATLIPYVNYRIAIPNEEIAPLVSGNYILTVYDEADVDTPILEAPFMVAEQQARLIADVTSRTDYDYNGSHQQLEVTADLRGLDIRDPWNDLRLVITPNGRRDASRIITRPMSVNADRATFAHDPALTFTAGNEYRRFETVTPTRFLPMGVESVAFDDPWYIFLLTTDTPRAGREYSYDQTQFGRFAINADDASDPSTEADYVKVFFTLDIAEQPEADIIIEGELTGRDLSPSSPGLMTFNRQTNRYEATLTLKQGSYNYQYLTLPRDGSSPALSGPIEGDDYRTANEYAVALYYRRPSDRYDRLIGFTTIYSGR